MTTFLMLAFFGLVYALMGWTIHEWWNERDDV